MSKLESPPLLSPWALVKCTQLWWYQIRENHFLEMKCTPVKLIIVPIRQHEPILNIWKQWLHHFGSGELNDLQVLNISVIKKLRSQSEMHKSLELARCVGCKVLELVRCVGHRLSDLGSSFIIMFNIPSAPHIGLAPKLCVPHNGLALKICAHT